MQLSETPIKFDQVGRASARTVKLATRGHHDADRIRSDPLPGMVSRFFFRVDLSAFSADHGSSEQAPAASPSDATPSQRWMDINSTDYPLPQRLYGTGPMSAAVMTDDNASYGPQAR